MIVAQKITFRFRTWLDWGFPMHRSTSRSESRHRQAPSPIAYRSVSDFFLVDESQDLRGRAFKPEAGSLSAGTVTDMLVDPEAKRVALIELSDGRRIPIEAIRLRGRYVTLQS